MRPAQVRTVYLRVQMYLEVKLEKGSPRCFPTVSKRSQGVFGKVPLT